MTLPDPSVERRLAVLERRLAEAELSLARARLTPRFTEPISARLWQFTLNEDMADGTGTADLVTLDGTDTLLDVEITDLVGNLGNLGNGIQGQCLEQMDVDGTRYYAIIGTNGLVEMCLAENHPGRGVVFDVYMGTWSPDNNKWEYDELSTHKAIDWRYGMPYPDAGGKGLFHPQTSTTHGVIYDCVSLDCDSPGTCAD